MEREEFQPYTVALGQWSREGATLVSSQIESISQKFGIAPEIKDSFPLELRSDEHFWKPIRSKEIHRGAFVQLRAFSVCDWIPRWPGLYVTERARRARHEAAMYLFRDDDPRIRRWQSRNPALYEKFKDMKIYASHGKQRMLDGGRGCVRLSSYTKPCGEAYLFTAYTGNTPESGIPIEITQDLHDALIDEITHKGSASGVTVSGTLRDAPEFFRDPYDRGVQRLIVVADRILREPGRQKPPMISVPISFLDGSTEEARILVSYASFFASDPHGYEMAVEFLDGVYVKCLYDGRILTDFDETQLNFDEAILSLKKINSGCLTDPGVRRSVDRALGGRSWLGGLEEASIYIGTNIEKMEKTENYHIHDSKNVAIKSQNVTQIDPTAAVRSNVMQGLTDVLIVTVTPVESRTLLDIFKRGLSRDAKIETINGHAYYDLGRINKASTFMGFSEMGAAGPGGSQQSVRRAIEALQPYSVIMVGIAFGVDERKQAIGEVLVSQQLRLYDLQRVGKDHIRLRGDRPHASTRLINLCQACIPLWPGARVRIGTILTGDKLVDNIDYRDELRRLEPEAVVGEMEGAGLYVACEEKKIDWILVKSICDWGDGNKDNTNKEQDQEVAAQNAAGFVLHVLQRVSLARPDRPALDAADLEKEDHKAEWPVYQIAFLWHEIDPPAAQVHWNLMNRDVADTKEMLHRAVEEGKLAVAREYRSANGVTRYVTRAELERFAISIGERPRFLFKESRCIA